MMTIRFCDKDPCPSLQKALDVLIPYPLVGEQLQIIVSPRDSSQPPQRVFFDYCPFCGTRIEPEWIEAAKDREPDDE